MKRWGLILLVGILGTYASARTATHYADWLSGSFFYPAMERDEAVHLVAGPAARWLPGVLATVPPSEAVVYLADGMAEADWLAAYYLYPRRLHVRSAALASVPRDLRSEARELGAGWLLHRGVLFSLPDLKSVRPAQGDATGFPPAPPSVRGFLALLLTALCSLGWGAFLFGRLPMPGLLKRTPLTGRLGLALLAGLDRKSVV